MELIDVITSKENLNKMCIRDSDRGEAGGNPGTGLHRKGKEPDPGPDGAGLDPSAS